MRLRAKLRGIRRLGASFKAAIKQTSCLELSLFRKPERKFIVHSRSLGLPMGLIDNLEELVQSLESSAHK